MKSSIFLVVSENTLALSVLHNQVNSEVFDEVIGVVA